MIDPNLSRFLAKREKEWEEYYAKVLPPHKYPIVLRFGPCSSFDKYLDTIQKMIEALGDESYLAKPLGICDGLKFRKITFFDKIQNVYSCLRDEKQRAYEVCEEVETFFSQNEEWNKKVDVNILDPFHKMRIFKIDPYHHNVWSRVEGLQMMISRSQRIDAMAKAILEKRPFPDFSAPPMPTDLSIDIDL